MVKTMLFGFLAVLLVVSSVLLGCKSGQPTTPLTTTTTTTTKTTTTTTTTTTSNTTATTTSTTGQTLGDILGRAAGVSSLQYDMVITAPRAKVLTHSIASARNFLAESMRIQRFTYVLGY